MAENLKAFENLSEKANDRLSDAEKKELNKISTEDIRSQKKKIGDKEFNFDGKKMKLSDIVKDLQIAADRSNASLNGKLVGKGSEFWGSDLGAAIQVYVIAHNKDVGRFKIDGMVGKDTLLGVQGTQTDVKAEKKEKAPEKVQLISVGALKDTAFNEYIQPQSNIKYFENKGILDPNSGVLKFRNKSTYVTDNKLKFSYQFKGKNISFEVPLNQDVNHKVNPKGIADNIREEMAAQEKKVTTNQNNVGAEHGIDSFREKNITDPIVKKWAELKDIDFECDSWDNGRIQIRAVSDGKNLKKFMRNNTDVLTNGSFDSAKFNAILTKECHSMALAEVKTSLNKTKTAIDKAKIGSVSDASGVISRYGNLITEIDSYKSNELKNEKLGVEQAKKLAEMKKFCYEEFGKMDSDIKMLNNMPKVTTKENKQKVLNAIQKYAKLTKTSTGKYDYRYKLEGYKTTSYRDNFWKTGLSNTWRNKVNSMVKVADDLEIQIDR